MTIDILHLVSVLDSLFVTNMIVSNLFYERNKAVHSFVCLGGEELGRLGGRGWGGGGGENMTIAKPIL